MRKGFARILVANIINLLINIFNSLLLPKFLSVGTYASIKTYTLYIGYAGFLSLGFADGMYLKYGGDDYSKIDHDDLNTTFKSYILLESVITVLILAIAISVGDFILSAFAIGTLFINIIGYHKNFYQAVGEYKLYGKALNYQAILLFVLNISLLFIVKSDNSSLYIIAQVLSAALVAVYLTFIIGRKTGLIYKGKASLLDIKNNVASGFSLMLGNFSSSVFTSLDKWFVKVLLDASNFAYYSFAVSLENIINVFITPITVSLYNVFCKDRSTTNILRVKRFTVLWGFLVITAVYPVQWIVNHYLQNYRDSLDVISFLFAAQAFYAIIKGIHVNLYKAEHKQKKYFVLMLIMTGIAALLNGIFYLIYNKAISFAVATFITAVLWFMYCEIENKEIRLGSKEYITMGCLLSTFFITARLTNEVFGLLIYLCVFLATTYFLMHATLIEAVEMVKDILNIKRRRSEK